MSNKKVVPLLAAFLCALAAAPVAMAAVARTPGDRYYVGVGIGDITGPAADVNMMGYANIMQTTKGIHLRVYARAFIFADAPDSKNRFVFVTADMGMMSQLVKLDVLKELEVKFPGFYRADNVLMSGTHTHSGTAGFFQYFMIEITSLGFVKESHEQFIRGIVTAIEKAHNGLKPAHLYINSGQLLNTQINRSPSAYLRNPPAERAIYKSDTDVNMHLLRIDDDKGIPMGMVNWFPVHCVSMNFSNRLISGDNKGYASQMFERTMEPKSLAGKNTFVGAFAQAFEGDVSPNLAGPRCTDTGLPCDFETSSCNGKPILCVAAGPGKDMFESTKIIGENQLKKALELFNAATDNGVRGDIRFIHQYVDMSNVTVDLGNGRTGKTCTAAMGYAFSGGTMDGPTDLPFGTQGTDHTNPFLEQIVNIYKEPSPEMIECQHPKPILLPTGLMDFPYQWQPSIVGLQIVKVGQLVIVGVPGEFTTMSGRRMIAAITKVFADAGQTVRVVIAGLSNAYTHYITTPEEYSRQRYEGGSTIFGPYTLPAYIQIFKELAKALISGKAVDEGPQPPYLKDKQWSLLPPVIFDKPGSKAFGDVVKPPQPVYRPGDVVTVEFIGANPRNSIGLEAFIKVDQLIPTAHTAGEWKTIFTDAEWETRFHWERNSVIQGTSTAILEWFIPAGQEKGTYRICYFGHSKAFMADLVPFSGCSTSFTIVTSS